MAVPKRKVSKARRDKRHPPGSRFAQCGAVHRGFSFSVSFPLLYVQHLDDGSSLTSYRKDVATILPSEFPTSISPCADGSINQDSWDSSNTVRAYTTIYYDIVKDSGDRSYYKLTKVTGKYYCNNSATKITSQTLRIGQTGWTSNGYREQTKDFDIPASAKDIFPMQYSNL